MTPRVPRWDTDVSAWIGPYPFRELPHPDADTLLRVLDREGIKSAWVGAMAAPWQRDPAPLNAWLVSECARVSPRLQPALTVRPGWPRWEAVLAQAVALGASSVRAYPRHAGVAATASAWHECAAACGAAGLVLQLTVRFEDLRQASALDVAGALDAAHIRAAVRSDPRTQVVVSGAGLELIEECHWSLTPAEQGRLYWDWAWVWGPPEDQFTHLLRTLGADRFTFGGYWPLRLIQGPVATAELLPPDLLSFTGTPGSAIAEAARRASARA